MSATSVPVTAAAVASASAAAAPLLTYAASFPVSSASRFPTASCNSKMLTNAPALSAIACATWGAMMLPPRRV